MPRKHDKNYARKGEITDETRALKLLDYIVVADAVIGVDYERHHKGEKYRLLCIGGLADGWVN